MCSEYIIKYEYFLSTVSTSLAYPFSEASACTEGVLSKVSTSCECFLSVVGTPLKCHFERRRRRRRRVKA